MVARPKHELAEVLRLEKDTWEQAIKNGWERRTLYALMRCRTWELGGHIDRCSHESCKRLHLSYNSCRNRHCPKCQGHLRESWIAKRNEDLLNTSYFHVVFTLPDVLNEIVLSHPKELYNTLFETSWTVLKDFGCNPKFLGAKTGMIGVLHTWGQNLSLHPHLHCIVPGGGWNTNGKWKVAKNKGKYLFPVKEMSKVFRAKFVASLMKKVAIKPEIRKRLFTKSWVVYAKQPFFGPQQVIEYLGRYTHKIAISNHRIKSIENGKVRFSVKDYKQGGKKKELSLDAKEFIRRFSLHILPKGYTRIRHYGILASSTKKQYKVQIDAQIGRKQVKVKQEHTSLKGICPTCKQGKLVTLFQFDKRGPPPEWIERIAKARQLKTT